MITNIRLSNFRAFQSGINVRIRPITLLIGQNSGGKSSFIKFLLMLRQTIESQSDQFFVTDGKDVKLGTWLDLRHTNTRSGKHFDSYMRYRIDVRTEDLPSLDVQAMWQTASKNQFVGPALWKQTREYRGGATCFKTSLEYVQEFVRGEVS